MPDPSYLPKAKTGELVEARDSMKRELVRAVGDINTPYFLSRLERLIDAKITEALSAFGKPNQ